jgi:hypothetical protein
VGSMVDHTHEPIDHIDHCTRHPVFKKIIMSYYITPHYLGIVI